MTSKELIRDTANIMYEALQKVPIPKRSVVEIELRLGRKHHTCFRPGVSRVDFMRLLHKVSACMDWSATSSSHCTDYYHSDGTRRRLQENGVCQITRKKTHLRHDITMPLSSAFDIRMSLCEEPLLTIIPTCPSTFERVKHTHTFSERFWRFDFAVTTAKPLPHANVIKDLDEETMTTYEIELELLDVSTLSDLTTTVLIVRRAFALCDSLTSILNHDGQQS